MPTVQELFAFENQHPRHTSRKEMLIVDELGLSPARYYQLLLHAAQSIEGWEADPMLCDRVTLRALTSRSRHLRAV